MNERDCVPIKLQIQIQPAGPMWPTPTLENGGVTTQTEPGPLTDGLTTKTIHSEQCIGEK